MAPPPMMPSLPSGVANVAVVIAMRRSTERDLEATAHAEAIDRGDGGLRRALELIGQPLHDRLECFSIAVQYFGKIRTGRERRSPAPVMNHPHCVVVRRLARGTEDRPASPARSH